MSTEYGNFRDAVDDRYACIVHSGTGGVCIFSFLVKDGKGTKFWLKDKDIEAFIESIILARNQTEDNL